MPKYQIVSSSAGCGTDHTGYIEAHTIQIAAQVARTRALTDEEYRPWGECDSVDIRGPVDQHPFPEHEIVFVNLDDFIRYERNAKRRERRRRNRKKRKHMNINQPLVQGYIVNGYVLVPRTGGNVQAVFTKPNPAKDFLENELAGSDCVMQQRTLIVWADDSGTASLFDTNETFRWVVSDDYTSEPERKRQELREQALSKLTPEERKAIGVAPRL